MFKFFKKLASYRNYWTLYTVLWTLESIEPKSSSALPFIDCVFLSKLLKCSVPQFPFMKNGDNNFYS